MATIRTHLAKLVRPFDTATLELTYEEVAFLTVIVGNCFGGLDTSQGIYDALTSVLSYGDAEKLFSHEKSAYVHKEG